MADYLTDRDGIWQFARRVPLEYAAIDPRGVIKLTTKIPVRTDRRGIKASKIAAKMNRELEAHWRGLSKGKPHAETAELLKRLVQDDAAECLLLMRNILKLNAADRRKVLGLAEALVEGSDE